MSQSKWSWKHVQVVSHPQEQDRVMLMCPGPDCEWWYVYPKEFFLNLDGLREYAEEHVKLAHKKKKG